MPDADLSRPKVGVFVRHLRDRRRISQRELSALVGRSPAYISKVEAGLIDPSLRGFAEVAVALQMNPLEVWTIVRCEGAGVMDTPDTYSDHSHPHETKVS